MRFVLISVALLLAIQASFSLGKSHHKHHKRSFGTFDMNNEVKCVDHSYCVKYSQMDCASSFLKLNCKNLCGICESHKKVDLPMVLYYNKHKGGKSRVARSANPTYPPTTSQTLFDYVGGYRNWNFNFNDKHPIQMDWSKPQQPLKPADQAQQQNTPAQQTNNATAGQQTQQAQQQNDPKQQQQSAYSTQQQQQSAYQPQTAAAPQQAVAPAAAQPAAQPAVQQQQDTPAFKIPAQAFKLADKGKDVYINVPQNTQSQNVMNQAMNDEPSKANDDGPIQSFNYKPVKVPCPKGQECNYKGPDAPQINETFMLYCDDKFPNCGVLQSSCNESWLQVYCPKRCGICTPNDSAQGAQPSPIATDDSTEGNKVYPSNVSELNDDANVNIESELVAPEPSDKPQRARYTLHVTPKLKNGVPQTQEIFIMPPNAKPGGNIKPLVILKQKVTKAMVENIEIDVPPKGVEYSDEPKVEVIEGANHESLKVTEGKADLTQAEADLSQKNAAAAQPAPAPVAFAQAPAAAAPAQADQTAAPAAAPAPVAPAPAAAPAAPVADAAAAPAPAAYPEAPAAPAAAPAADAAAAPAPAAYPEAPAAAAAPAASPEPAAAQAPAAAPEPAAAPATSQYNAQTQSYQDNTQTQAAAQPDQTAQTQTTQDQAAQSYQQSTQTAYDQNQQAAAAPTVAPTTAPASASYPAAYPAQDSQQTYQASQCVDDSRCASYSKEICNESWMQNNCKKMCSLC